MVMSSYITKLFFLTYSRGKSHSFAASIVLQQPPPTLMEKTEEKDGLAAASLSTYQTFKYKEDHLC